MAIVCKREHESGLLRIYDHLSAYAPSLLVSLSHSSCLCPRCAPSFPMLTIAAPTNTSETF